MPTMTARDRLHAAVAARQAEMPQVLENGLAIAMRAAGGAVEGEFLPRMTENQAAELSRLLGIEPLRPIGHNLWAVATIITPQMATRWLAENNRTNRVPKLEHAARLKHDILSGRWFLTHEAIAFRSDGQLQDGQHRLFAVSEAGLPVIMTIIGNVTDEAQLVIDTGASRSAIDYLRFRTGRDVPQMLESAVRLAYKVTHGKEWTNPELGEALLRFYPAFNWAFNLFPQRVAGVRNHAVFAALACAVHQVTEVGQLDRLEEFAKVLCTGATQDPERDQAAITLANMLRTAQRQSAIKSNTVYRYKCVSRAIELFLAGTAAQNIRPREESGYRLPADPPDYHTFLNGRLILHFPE